MHATIFLVLALGQYAFALASGQASGNSSLQVLSQKAESVPRRRADGLTVRSASSTVLAPRYERKHHGYGHGYKSHGYHGRGWLKRRNGQHGGYGHGGYHGRGRVAVPAESGNHKLTARTETHHEGYGYGGHHGRERNVARAVEGGTLTGKHPLLARSPAGEQTTQNMTFPLATQVNPQNPILNGTAPLSPSGKVRAADYYYKYGGYVKENGRKNVEYEEIEGGVDYGYGYETKHY